MTKSVFLGLPAHGLLVLSLLGLAGCYAKVEVGDSSADKAIAIDWVEPPCAEPGSAAGYIEGNGFGAKNVTITIGGIEAEVLAATGKDASFVVPEELTPGPIEVVVENPGGRIATINWVVCGFDCSAIDCDDGNECTADICDPVGGCTNDPVANGTSCSGGVCVDGLCALGPDTEPPVLTDFDFNPESVDVSTQSQDVICTMTATDSPAGVESVVCTFRSPSETQTQRCVAGTPSSGDAFNGVWSCTTTIPQNSEVGTWLVDVALYDTVGNSDRYYTADLQASGLPTQLDVTSQDTDTEPPVLTDFDFNPKSVDVSTQSQDVTCTMTATDSPAGVESVVCTFRSPSETQTQRCVAGTPSSGDAFNGVWSCTTTIPQNSEAGTWLVDVALYDTVGNSDRYYTADLQASGLPTQLDVTSQDTDTEPPVLTDFDFNPKSVDVSTQSQDVTCTMTATDSPAGVESVVCTFRSPSETQTQRCVAGTPSSGDAFNGVWSCTTTIPQNSEAGTWLVDVALYDTVGNSDRYYTADLQASGFPTQLDVTYGGGPDLDPPLPTALDFNPKQVDVSSQDQVVTCDVTLIDQTGADNVRCRFLSPSGTQAQQCYAFAPSSGDRNNGDWTCSVTLSTGSEAGTWVLEYIETIDVVSNRKAFRTPELDALGFPTQLDVTSSILDLDPPLPTALDFNPKQVDVSSQDQVVTCDVTLIDQTGADNVRCRFLSPSGTQAQQCYAFAPSSGDRNNGDWTCSVTLSTGSEAGTWVLEYIETIDVVSNRKAFRTPELDALGFPTQLDVTSSILDLDPPLPTALDFNPKQVDVSSQDQVVTCDVTLIDQTGADNVRCRFLSPSGTQAQQCYAFAPSSGDRNNGDWTCSVTLSTGSEAGTWVLEYIETIDVVSNRKAFRTPELDALGFPTQLGVTYGGSSPPP